MNIFSLTASLLMAGLTLAPLAEAAPKGKKTSQSSKKTSSKPKSQPKKQQQPKEQPKEQPKPENKPAPQPAAVPADVQNKEGYQAFYKKLDDQVALNSYDFCPAITVGLAAADNNEFTVLAWMQHASDAGNPAAQYFVAAQWLSSPLAVAGSPEVTNAMQLLKNAADKGFMPAQLEYAGFLRAGHGVEKDEKASNDILIKLCTTTEGENNMQARFKWLLLSGRLASAEDFNRPEVKSEIERGNHHVMFYMCHFLTGEEQIKMLQDAAKLGNMDAVYCLGTITFQTEAAAGYELLKIAVEAHHNCAIFVLGTILMEPNTEKLKSIGVTADYETGMLFLRTSFLMGNGEAGAILGGIYYEGLYNQPENKERAFLHYKYAYMYHADVAAYAAMGYMLVKGEGVPADPKAGFEMLEAAEKAGAPNAPILLAYLHYEGIGCEKNAAKALEYLQFTVYSPYTYVFMAYIYAKGGVDVPADPDTADSYLRMAELEMGDEARKLFDEMMSKEHWAPHP